MPSNFLLTLKLKLLSLLTLVHMWQVICNHEMLKETSNNSTVFVSVVKQKILGPEMQEKLIDVTKDIKVSMKSQICILSPVPH